MTKEAWLATLEKQLVRTQALWVCAVLAATSGPAAGADPPVKPEPTARGLADDRAVAAFYRPDEVQSVNLQIADADLKRMLAALPERVDVPASFRWRDVTVTNVSVRFKGSSSSDPRQAHKRSFLAKFDGHDKTRRFFGLRQVSFDNGVQFGSLFSEPVITDVLRDHGVTTHRYVLAKGVYSAATGNDALRPDHGGSQWAKS